MCRVRFRRGKPSWMLVGGDQVWAATWRWCQVEKVSIQRGRTSPHRLTQAAITAQSPTPSIMSTSNIWFVFMLPLNIEHRQDWKERMAGWSVCKVSTFPCVKQLSRSHHCSVAEAAYTWRRSEAKPGPSGPVTLAASWQPVHSGQCLHLGHNPQPYRKYGPGWHVKLNREALQV